MLLQFTSLVMYKQQKYAGADDQDSQVTAKVLCQGNGRGGKYSIVVG